MVVYGGNSAGDVLNVYRHARGVTRSSSIPTTVDVNGNTIDYSGIERIRVVKQGGSDDVQIDRDVLAEVLAVMFWNPRDEE